MTNKLITTPSELLNFLKDLTDNYDNLTKDEYFQCIKDSFGVFEFDKPKNKDFAIKRIESHYEKIKNLKHELPLFLEYEEIYYQNS